LLGVKQSTKFLPFSKRWRNHTNASKLFYCNICVCMSKQ
jgi:hypothetical protein